MGADESNQISEIIFQEDKNKLGHYYPDSSYTTELEFPDFLNRFYLNNDYRLYSGRTYTLNAVIGGDTLTAHTTIPDSIHFFSEGAVNDCGGDSLGTDIQLDNFNYDNLSKLPILHPCRLLGFQMHISNFLQSL